MIWSTDWPTEEGNYWFHGKRWATGETQSWFVRVFRVMNGVIFNCEGNALYEKEAIGIWAVAQVPAPSEVEDE